MDLQGPQSGDFNSHQRGHVGWQADHNQHDKQVGMEEQEGMISITPWQYGRLSALMQDLQTGIIDPLLLPKFLLSNFGVRAPRQVKRLTTYVVVQVLRTNRAIGNLISVLGINVQLLPSSLCSRVNSPEER